MRTADCKRTTGETDISLKLNLDGTGKADIKTGHAFFDHMLHLLSRHSLIDMELRTVGDLEVDAHHTVEDTGIVIGETILKVLYEEKLFFGVLHLKITSLSTISFAAFAT